MEGFTPNPSAFGQHVNPTSFGTNETSHPNQTWNARGARGGSRGRGTRGNAFRGGGSTQSARGKSFSNKSAVFNTASQNITAEENEEEGSIDHEQPETSSSGFFQSSFGAPSKSVNKQVKSNTQSFSQMQDDSDFESEPAEEVQLNALGGSKESEQDRKNRFENLPKQNRFFEMRAQREIVRAKYIREGILPDPEKPTDLTEAKTLTGTCMEMCPDFEREEREFQNEGDTLEMFPGTNRIDPTIAVKIYRRPAAGRELPLPEDVRPPEVLRMTLDYLLHQLLPSDPGSPIFTSVQPFMWNRTRAIRQDFIVQGDGGELAIECHERIARYHILCLHWRGGVGAEGWSEQQELEQLRKTIRSLTEFYEDIRRKKGVISPNEAEFRSYNLLLHMQDPETLREAEGLPTSILQADCVQVALKVRAYAQRSNNVLRRGRPLNTEATINLWTRFFGELRRNPNVNYLLACLAENIFSPVRAGALKAMSKTYNVQHAPLPLDYLKRSLGLDHEEQARSFAIELGAEEAFDTNGNLIGLRLSKITDDKALPLSPFSKTIVEARRGRYTAQDVVDGIASGASPLIPISIKPAHPRTIPILPAQSAPKQQAPFAFQPIPKLPSKPLQQDTHFEPSPLLSAKAPAFTPSAPSLQVPENIIPTPQQKPKAVNTFSQPTFSANTFDAKEPSTSTWPSQPGAFPSLAPKEESKQSFGANSFSFAKPKEESKGSSFNFSVPAKPSEATFSSIPSLSKLPVQINEPKVQPHPPPVPQQEELPIKDATEEKDTKASALPAPTALPRAPSPKPVAPVAPKRTIESVAKGLVARLIQEVVVKKVYAITEQACLREARLRQAEVRNHLIKGLSNDLCSMMLNETVKEIVTSQAEAALADELYCRNLIAMQWNRWRDALSRARLRNYQNARLIELKKRLESKRTQIKTSKPPQISHEKDLQPLNEPNKYVVDRSDLLLEDVTTVCVAPLRSMLEKIEFCINRIEQIAHQKQNSSLQNNLQNILQYAFEISSVLTQRVYSDIVAVSEVASDENNFDQDAEIPIPSSFTKEQDLTIHLFSLAYSQLSDIAAKFIKQGKDDAEISLVQTWLLEQSKKSKQTENSQTKLGFPWSEYFNRLLFVYIDELQERWMETIFLTKEEIETTVQPSKYIFEEAANEIESRVRKIILDQPIQTNNQNKRRSQSDDLLEDADYSHNERPVAKLRRTNGDIKQEKVANVKPPSSSAITSLRSLINSANQMLNQSR